MKTIITFGFSLLAGVSAKLSDLMSFANSCSLDQPPSTICPTGDEKDIAISTCSDKAGVNETALYECLQYCYNCCLDATKQLLINCSDGGGGSSNSSRSTSKGAAAGLATAGSFFLVLYAGCLVSIYRFGLKKSNLLCAGTSLTIGANLVGAAVQVAGGTSAAPVLGTLLIGTVVGMGIFGLKVKNSYSHGTEDHKTALVVVMPCLDSKDVVIQTQQVTLSCPRFC